MKNKKILLIMAWGIVTFNVWHISSRPFWSGSVLNAIGVGPNTLELAQKTFPDIQIKRPYDGQFYFATAHDPLIRNGSALPYIDVPSYRYRRVLTSVMAWILSMGFPNRLPLALFLINMAAWLLCGWAALKIAQEEKINIALAVVGVMTISGLQFAAFRTLTEPLSLACLLWGLWRFQKKSWKTAFLLMGLACLARETTVVAVAAALTAHFTPPYRQEISRRKILMFFTVGILPFLMWTFYVPTRLAYLQKNPENLHHKTGFMPALSFEKGPTLVKPFTGMLDGSKKLFSPAITHTERRRSLSITIETLILMGLAAVLFLRRKSLWTMLGLAEAVFCVFIQSEVWDYYAGSSRVVIHLTCFVLFELLCQSKK